MKKILPLIIILLLLFYCTNKRMDEIKAPGVINAEIITLKALVSGTLDKINHKQGDRVKKWHPLMHINSEKIQNQLKELDLNLKSIQISREQLKEKNKLTEATIVHFKKQVQRFKRLKQNNSIAGEKLESMELKLQEVQTLKFEIQKNSEDLLIQIEKIDNKKEYLNLLLKDHHITSPVEGIILEKFVSAGENIFINSPMVLMTGP